MSNKSHIDSYDIDSMFIKISDGMHETLYQNLHTTLLRHLYRQTSITSANCANCANRLSGEFNTLYYN
jgi:hypothetical protein